MKLKIGEPELIYCAPLNEATSKWGVYAIPRMWRNYTGELVVRINGEQDNGFTTQCLPNLYFVSRDNGKSWQEEKDGEKIYDINFINGVDSPFVRLKNGKIIGVRKKHGLKPISEITFEKEFALPCGSAIAHTYKYGAIPKSCAGAELFEYQNGQAIFKEIKYDFPEREVMVFAKGFTGSHYEDMPEYIDASIFSYPYFSGITRLDDKTLVAVTHGQTPSVYDRQCEDCYLIASEDGGITWKYRSTVASDPTLPFGCCGDGSEISLAKTSNGNLLCAMRTDMSIDGFPADTLLCISHDCGYTWSKPLKIADSSVTPHIIALDGGIAVLVYGRPGVHFRVSEDNGMTWSDSYPIIGKTLREELESGKSYMDAKYGDTSSYSNTFVEKISENTVLILYNDMKYDCGDGKKHKATLVRTVTVTAD